MTTIKQVRGHIIFIKSKTDHLSLKTAKQLRDFLYHSFPKIHSQNICFVLAQELFYDTKSGAETWKLSFSSTDRVVSDRSNGLPQGLQTAIEPDDVRDYLLDFVCQKDLDPSVELSFSTNWNTAHFETLIAHKI